jgi:hypothetical protein
MGNWRALTIVPLAGLLLIGPVLAQDVSDYDVVSNSSVVPPADCLAEPRTSADITAILKLDGKGVPAPDPIRITPPLGEMADAETTREIRVAVRRLIACFNADDIRRAAGLMTKNGVQQAYWGLTVNEEHREQVRNRMAAAREPRAQEDLVSLFAVTDVSVLRDERVGAFVILDEPLLPPDGLETLLFVFANQDGIWLLDALADFTIVPVVGGAEATPAA